MPKKYRLVQTDIQPQEVLRVDFNMESSVPSKLPADVQLLIKEMVRFSVFCYVFFWRVVNTDCSVAPSLSSVFIGSVWSVLMVENQHMYQI